MAEAKKGGTATSQTSKKADQGPKDEAPKDDKGEGSTPAAQSDKDAKTDKGHDNPNQPGQRGHGTSIKDKVKGQAQNPDAVPALDPDDDPGGMFTPGPDTHDPVVEEGKGYDGLGNVYPEGTKAKVNKARTAMVAAREAQERADRLRADADELVDHALEDDPDDVDDLHQFKSDSSD